VYFDISSIDLAIALVELGDFGLLDVREDLLFKALDRHKIIELNLPQQCGQALVFLSRNHKFDSLIGPFRLDVQALFCHNSLKILTVGQICFEQITTLE
jgi:hypothetical protein